MTRRLVPYAWSDGNVSIAVDDAPGRGSRAGLWPSVGEYPCYDPFLYHQMSQDNVRNRAFRTVLRRLAPGRRVLDIGTGQDVNWALEAARSGASRVVAVEAIPESHARAADNLSGRPEAPFIELRQGSSFDLELKERAQVCVAELIGSIASAEGMLSVIRDARHRLLEPDATVVPARCETIIGGISLHSLFPEGPAFSADALPYLLRIFDELGGPFDIRLAIANVGPECLVTTTAVAEHLVFDHALELNGKSESTLEVLHDDEIDGLLCWIRLAVGSGVPVIDSLAQKTSWIPAYLPLFEQPVKVARGDTLDVLFERQTSADGVHPDYVAAAVLSTSAATVTGSFRSTYLPGARGSTGVYRQLLTG